MALKKLYINLKASRYIAAVTILVFSLSGCQSLSGFFNTGPHSGKYKSALKEWTREGNVYSGFDLEANIFVTYLSKSFRASWVDEYTLINALSDAEKEKLLEDQMAAANEHHEFFGAAFIPEKDLNDLNERKASWKTFIKINDNEKVTPVEIRKINDEDASYQYFFPYITPWKTLYSVKFPVNYPGTDINIIDENTTNITLIITGPRGKVEMSWKLK
ncbi:MAG: hypothetical protein K9L30_12345 [Desulfobacterales bacterium]|nr:hypothetical protein [Desulfobacterales bacterium]